MNKEYEKIVNDFKYHCHGAICAMVGIGFGIIVNKLMGINAALLIGGGTCIVFVLLKAWVSHRKIKNIEEDE